MCSLHLNNNIMKEMCVKMRQKCEQMKFDWNKNKKIYVQLAEAAVCSHLDKNRFMRVIFSRSSTTSEKIILFFFYFILLPELRTFFTQKFFCVWRSKKFSRSVFKLSNKIFVTWKTLPSQRECEFKEM